MSGVLGQTLGRTPCRYGLYSGSVQLDWTACRHLSSSCARRFVRIDRTVTMNRLFTIQRRHYTRKNKIEFVYEDRENIDTLLAKYIMFRPRNTSKFVRQLFLLDRKLCRTIIDKMWPNGSIREEKSHILECSPGPGILTEELLKAGAPRVVALEKQECFLPFLKELHNQYPNRLEYVYADVSRLDPVGVGEVILPARTSHDLFQIIGAKSQEWEAEPVIKCIRNVAHIFNERAMLLKNIYSLINRFSWFQFGRVEYYFFVSYRDYMAITHTTSLRNRGNYVAVAVLYDIASNVELLHVEPMESFLPDRKKTDNSANPKPTDIYLIKVTPKRDLFSYNMSRTDYSLLCFMVKQFMSKKTLNLMETVENYAPGHGQIVTKLGLDKHTVTGDVTGQQYFQIFREIANNNGFDGSWWRDDALDFINGAIVDSDYNSSISRARYGFCI